MPHTRKTTTLTPGTTPRERASAATIHRLETAMRADPDRSATHTPATMRPELAAWTTTRTPVWFTAAQQVSPAMHTRDNPLLGHTDSLTTPTPETAPLITATTPMPT